jgi:murein DD-endopeptidase MepM/ murein hydrolase activator NlpD
VGARTCTIDPDVRAGSALAADVGHNPAVPRRRSQHFPHATQRRRPHVRFALLGTVAAVVVLLAIPAAAPRGSVLDIQGTGAGIDATAQGQTAPATPEPTAPAAAPTPSATPGPGTGSTTGAAYIGLGRSQPHLPAAPSIDSLAGYRWPLAHPRLTLPFGPTPWGTRLVGGKLFHDGIDVATFCGDRITAAHKGTVIAAGRHYDDVMGWVGDLAPYYRRLDRGKLWSTLPIVVVIDDGNGYRSMYAHFSQIVVKKGQVVRAGQFLGYEGMTGRASGCHLHYGLFSPWETRTFRLKPDTAKRMKLPSREIARVDPLSVLPAHRGIHVPKKPKASDTRPPKGTPTSP